MIYWEWELVLYVTNFAFVITILKKPLPFVVIINFVIMTTDIINFTLLATNILNFMITITDLTQGRLQRGSGAS